MLCSASFDMLCLLALLPLLQANPWFIFEHFVSITVGVLINEFGIIE